MITGHLHVAVLVAELKHVAGLPGDGGGAVELPLGVVPLLHLTAEIHFQQKVVQLMSRCNLA